MTFLWFSHDFLMTFSWISHDFLKTFSWFSHDFLLTSFGLSNDFLLSFSLLSNDFFMVFSWISHNFHMTFLWISHNFLMTFSWLSHAFLMNFSWISHEFLMTFWIGHSLCRFGPCSSSWFYFYLIFFSFLVSVLVFLGIGVIPEVEWSPLCVFVESYWLALTIDALHWYDFFSRLVCQWEILDITVEL